MTKRTRSVFISLVTSWWVTSRESSTSTPACPIWIWIQRSGNALCQQSSHSTAVTAFTPNKWQINKITRWKWIPIERIYLRWPPTKSWLWLFTSSLRTGIIYCWWNHRYLISLQKCNYILSYLYMIFKIKTVSCNLIFIKPVDCMVLYQNLWKIGTFKGETSLSSYLLPLSQTCSF